MKLFDLHCDTILECYETHQPLKSNNLHISLNRAEKYEKYSQVLGIYSKSSLSDEEAYCNFLNISDFYKKQEFTENFTPILAVEGANLLGGDITRLTELFNRGVKFLTLVWGGKSCIGGAHNDGDGFTAFGFDVARRCLELGIIMDISHASDKLFYEAAELAEAAAKPIAATHSNSRIIKNHTRNLTDEMFTTISKMGGVVGISLVKGHLREWNNCNIDDIISHIEHFLSLGGEKTLCLGCDLDGTSPLPDGINGIEDIYKIADRLSTLNYGEDLIADMFYNNADNFMLRNGVYQ